MATWLFQGNPKYFRVTEALRDFNEMHWMTSRYQTAISPGDEVVIWVAGKEAGIYALATVTEAARVQDAGQLPDRDYWRTIPDGMSARPVCGIRFTRKLLDRPILWTDLKNDPVLKNLLVIRAPNSTNYRVSAEEWSRIQELAR